MNDHQPITEPCPACSQARDLFHRFICEIERQREISLIGETFTTTEDFKKVEIEKNTLTMHCQQCNDHKEVLTDFGSHLAKMAYAAAVRLATSRTDEFVPDEINIVENAAVRAFLEDPPYVSGT